jgi:hypothetical protein
MPPSDVLHQMSGVMRPSFSEKIVDGTADSNRPIGALTRDVDVFAAR